MHEILLFAPIPAVQHHDLLLQLCGLTAMQPNRLYERHLIFKAYRKPGFVKTRLGGSQDVQLPEVQRLNKLLNSGLYYMQAVAEVGPKDFAAATEAETPDVVMDGTQFPTPSSPSWRVEFKDIPDAGTVSAVTSRFVGSAKLPPGDVLSVMKTWGFDYVSEYVVQGDMFVLDDMVLFLHRVLNLPENSPPPPQQQQQPQQPTPKTPVQSLPPFKNLSLLDPSGGYILQACVTVQDSGNPDLLKAASQRLLALKEQLKSIVRLEPADRLSLDTRIKS